MRLTNFKFDSSIEIGSGDQYRWLDLHNCFDWQGLKYSSEERRIELMWTRGSGEWVQASLPAKIVLEFRQVARFAASPRDPELPYKEDSCLAFVTFSPPEFSLDFEAEFGGYRSESEHLTLRFQSGFGLKIWADEAELILPSVT